MNFHKIKSKMHNTLVLLFIMALAIVSCTTPETPFSPKLDQNQTVKSTIPKTPLVKNGYLHLDDEAHFLALIEYTQSLSLEKLEDYTQMLGFSSMRLEYEKLAAFSEASIETGYGMTFDELRKIYDDVAVIEDDGIIDINCFHDGIANLISREGLIQIGDDLNVYSLNKVIQIKDGDYTKVPIAKRLNESLESEGIFIFKLESVNNSTRTFCNSSLNIGSSWGGSGSATSIAERDWCFFIDGEVGDPCEYRLRVDLISLQTHANIDLYTRIRTHKRGAFGAWYKYSTDVRIGGNATLNSTDGGSVTRSSISIVSPGKDRNEAILSNYSGDTTSPMPPDPDFPYYYDEACVNLTFVMETGEGDGPTYSII
ncbi:MAG: hypothetical protein KDD99_01930 [Bacteroidetes bacterium]|nr:hypothetical protein [Bacteroidota bacterium]